MSFKSPYAKGLIKILWPFCKMLGPLRDGSCGRKLGLLRCAFEGDVAMPVSFSFAF